MASYPNYKPNDMQMTVNVWSSLLEDYDYKEIGAALKAFIATDTSGFAPSIGQLIDKVHTLRSGCIEEMSDAEAWAKVRNAISNSTYHAQEEYAKLPKAIQRAVGCADQLRVWAMDSDYNEGVTQSNFLRSYRTAKEREVEFNKMPVMIQDMIKSTTMRIEGVNE